MRLYLLVSVSVPLLLLLVSDSQSSPRRKLRTVHKRKFRSLSPRTVQGRRGKQESYRAGGEDNYVGADDSGSGSDIANGCDHLTNIGAMMTHAKELAWCLDNDPELELGLYAPLVALAETRAAEAEAAADGSGSGSGEEYQDEELQAVYEVVRAARRARARRGRSGSRGSHRGSRRGAGKGRTVRKSGKPGRKGRAGRRGGRQC